jgi:hypothetical protein
MRAAGFPVMTPTVFVDAANTGGTPTDVNAKYETSEPPPITPLIIPAIMPAAITSSASRSDISSTT